MVEAGRLRSVGLAVLAVGLVIGPAAVLAGGGPGSPAGAGAVNGLVRDDAQRSIPLDLELLGASGVLPTLQQLRPGEVATMVAPGDPAVIPPGSLTIPPVVLDAYRRAERVLALRSPDCGAPWWLLAGIGRVVTDHARGGGLDRHGTTTGPILGARLDGSPGVTEVADTDDGRLDGDSTWDRAAGPMQIIPGVWQRVGADGDRDGTADPHNVYDATLAAGRYLCENGADLRRPDGQVRAVFRYQRSGPFVRSTMLWARVYEAAAPPPPPADRVPALPPVEDVSVTETPPRAAELPSGPVSAPVSALPEGSAPPGSTPAPTPTAPGTTPTTSPPPPATTDPTAPPGGGGDQPPEQPPGSGGDQPPEQPPEDEPPEDEPPEDEPPTEAEPTEAEPTEVPSSEPGG